MTHANAMFIIGPHIYDDKSNVIIAKKKRNAFQLNHLMMNKVCKHIVYI